MLYLSCEYYINETRKSGGGLYTLGRGGGGVITGNSQYFKKYKPSKYVIKLCLWISFKATLSFPIVNPGSITDKYSNKHSVGLFWILALILSSSAKCFQYFNTLYGLSRRRASSSIRVALTTTSPI